jgi:hypothetical protein
MVTPSAQPVPPPPEAGGYRGKHPVVAFFHFIFKLAAVLGYVLGFLFGASFVTVFIMTALFQAADFWTVKNVSGRLLVRLRWWNKIKEDGESEWVFESHPNVTDVNGFDSYFFWALTYGAVAVWLVLTFFSLMSLTHLPLCILGVVLTGANAAGYTKCRQDAKKKLAAFLMSNPAVMRQAANAAI